MVEEDDCVSVADAYDRLSQWHADDIKRECNCNMRLQEFHNRLLLSSVWKCSVFEKSFLQLMRRVNRWIYWANSLTQWYYIVVTYQQSAPLCRLDHIHRPGLTSGVVTMRGGASIRLRLCLDMWAYPGRFCGQTQHHWSNVFLKWRKKEDFL